MQPPRDTPILDPVLDGASRCVVRLGRVVRHIGKGLAWPVGKFLVLPVDLPIASIAPSSHVTLASPFTYTHFPCMLRSVGWSIAALVQRDVERAPVFVSNLPLAQEMTARRSARRG